MRKRTPIDLDRDAVQALRLLQASGMSRSDAIGSSLVAAAAELRSSRAMAAEVARLEADDADRMEMLAIAAFMAGARTPA